MLIQTTSALASDDRIRFGSSDNNSRRAYRTSQEARLGAPAPDQRRPGCGRCRRGHLQYLDGTRRKVIRHVLLRRAPTETLLSKLGSGAADSVITGKAGTGKTGCIVDFLEQLAARNVPALAFRLDRIDPVSTTPELGRKLGFEESPALILAEAAHGREAVLVIDQLDAVSTTSGRATSFIEAVEGLLLEARGLRDRLPLHVVVACESLTGRTTIA